MDSQRQFLEEIARSMDYWTDVLVKSVSGKSDLRWTERPDDFRRLGELLQRAEAVDAFATVVREGLLGILHSVLVTFDGGTQLAESVLLNITDEHGRTFDRDLHDQFASHLFDTGRLE
jgi:hypothetical protein